MSYEINEKDPVLYEYLYDEMLEGQISKSNYSKIKKEEDFRMSLNKKKYFSRFAAVIDLEEIIEEVFGERFCEDLTLDSFGSVQGTIDGKKFWLSPFVGKESDGNIGAICVSANSQEDKDVLDELRPVISEIMSGVEPICRYDLLTTFTSYEKLDDEFDGETREIKETRMCPTIEWNIMNPESRIRSLIGKCGTEIENLQLLNGKSISDYEEKGQVNTLTRKLEKK